MANQQSDSEKETKTREAVAFAMEGRWQNAALVNKELADSHPDDTGVWNRLGKALLELGKYDEASDAFRRTLDLQPKNPIAVKNLERLEKLGKARSIPKPAAKRTPQLFIDESGVTTLSSLRDIPDNGILLQISPGDAVYLKSSGKKIFVMDSQDEYIGQIGARLATRIIRLQESGNRYEAAIGSVDDSGVDIVIRETYQDPTQSGTVSFPRKSDGLAEMRLGVSAVHDGSYDSDEDAVLDDTQLPPVPAWVEDDGEGLKDEDADEDTGNLTITTRVEEQDEVDESF